MERPIVVQLPKWVEEWWWRVAYLRPAPLDKLHRKFVEIEPDRRFKEVVQGYVNAYLKEGVAPPAEIATAVMNMADDILAGRDIVLKTGDYVALQQHMAGRK